MTISVLKQKVQVVTIAENQLLLLQFTEDRGSGYQNVTGSVDFGEDFIQAAVRELVEEIGLHESANHVIDIGLTFHFHDRWKSDVEEKVYLYNPVKKPVISLSPEHQSFKWVPIGEVTVAHFAFPTNYDAFKKAVEFLK
jgi:8-oxo-dGTP pyrophosphatase MutT (NUDIX family)